MGGGRGEEGGEAVSVAGLDYGPILQSDIITPTSLSLLGYQLISTDKTKCYYHRLAGREMLVLISKHAVR